jgi:hypothetical protein
MAIFQRFFSLVNSIALVMGLVALSAQAETIHAGQLGQNQSGQTGAGETAPGESAPGAPTPGTPLETVPNSPETEGTLPSPLDRPSNPPVRPGSESSRPPIDPSDPASTVPGVKPQGDEPYTVPATKPPTPQTRPETILPAPDRTP